MHPNVKRVLLLGAYYVASFGILNLAFPMNQYLSGRLYTGSPIVPGFLLLTFVTSLLTAVAFLVGMRGGKPLWVRVVRTAGLQFALVSAFAIACSGLGFGLSLGEFPFFRDFSLFFAEFEFLRFIFESAVPLAGCAAAFYFLEARNR